MSTLKYWVWLSALSGVSAASAGALLRRFATPEAIYFAHEREIREVPDLTTNAVQALRVKDLEDANRILGDCERLGVRILTLQDAEYPERLRNIYDAPVVLYVRGRLPAIDNEPIVAVVGTRTCTPYGISSADKIGYGIARRGITVTTGLARGVDTAAAVGALRGGGRVIGIVGGGVDVIYPAENAQLYEDVAASGAIISEYPPGTRPEGTHFPVRNRILSGISLGVAVIEAPLRSGALITASHALEQGRDVFAVPGNVDSVSSAGANRLLRDGAIPLTSAADIAREYIDLFPDKITPEAPRVSPAQRAERRAAEPISPRPKPENIESEVDKPPDAVYSESPASRSARIDGIAATLAEPDKTVFLTVARLSEGGTAHLDDVIAQSELAAADVLSAMTMLEIDGHVKNTGAGMFTINN